VVTGVRVLLIDNYDSYTYNLHQLLAAEYGVEPVVLRNDAPELARFDTSSVDAVVISPGPGTPVVAGDIGLTERFVRDSSLPVLGVCLGHQLLATMEGAEVRSAPRPVHGQASAVSHVDDDLFAGLPQRFAAIRYHSLSVMTPLPDSLVALAWSEEGVLMGLRHRSRPWWGVQFHPESIGTEQGAALVRNFARLAGHVPAARSRGEAKGGSERRGGRGVASPLPAGHPASPPRANRLLFSQRLDHPVSTSAAFQKLFGGDTYAFWLDSGMVVEGTSRFSFLGTADPDGEVLRYRTGTNQISVRHHGNWRAEPATDVFTVLSDRISALKIEPPEGAPFDFPCGYVGYLGYELKAECGATATRTADTPDAMWMLAGRMVVVDHEVGKTWVLALDADDWVRDTATVLAGLPEDACEEPVVPWQGDVEQWLARPHGQYLADVAECHRQLRLGNSYEICLTNHVELPFDGDPFELYTRLRRVNPAPYGAYLRFGELAVLSSSPERFLKVSQDGVAESRPIKGTARRDQDPVADAALRDRLPLDPKTRAENLMIVDLLRNDLGTVCEIGSVMVPRFMAVETYATLHQLVTTVRGRLRPEVGAVDAARACFPGGSMTGAPKLRTMALIDELEQRARGVYSGALGYFSATGAADLSIVIRTAVVGDGRLTLGAGGAIVVDSDAEAEYEEMVLKARSALRALAPGNGLSLRTRTA
jgi:para-aminobenzoate synthetase